jgi:hypothetical protein
MPVLRRLLWPWLLLPLGGAATVLAIAHRHGPILPVHALLALMAVGLFGAVYAALLGAYRQWSRPPPSSDGALVPPEPVVWVSKGGFLTPGSGLLTRDALVLFASGRAVITVPMDRLSSVRFLRGRWLRTPYVELFAKDGRSLGRLGVESAERWAQLLSERISAGS